MPRSEVPIDPRTGPQAAFAVELRQLRELAGVTYRELAQRAHCSYGALCEAARGQRLPTWEVTRAFVKGCGGDPLQWQARWQAVAAEIGVSPSTATATGDDGGTAAAPVDSSDVRESLSNGDIPPLSSLTSPQDFHLALRALRTRVGNPSLRDLSDLARKNGDHILPRSTLSDALTRTDRLPSLETVEAFLSACDVQVPEEVEAWKSSWARIAFLLQRDSMPAGGIRWQGSCPYRGLSAFDEDQTEVFYGRELMTTELLAHLADRVRGGMSMLVVTGPSGAGKSSLLRAGLLPALVKGSLGSGSQDWPRLVITPGSAPLDELAVHLAQLAGVHSAEIRQSLAEHPDKAHLNARQALLAGAGQQNGSEPRISPGRLVLIVDQFEELFTIVSDKAEREAFITSLCSLAGVGRSSTELAPAIVVLGLRDDFFSDCTGYPLLAEAVRSGLFVVGPMTEVELRSAITGPAVAAGLSVEAGLVDTVLAELRSTRTSGGFDSGALPLLSQAMLLAWEHREGTTLTHHAYAAGGGLHNGIQLSAEAAYLNLTSAQQEAARRVFLRMITFTDHGQLTRCPIQLNDLNLDSSTASDVRAALEEFTNKRLITLGRDTAEIVHEVLVHTWRRLGSWVDQDRERLRLSHTLEGAAKVWEENGRDSAFLYQGNRLAAVLDNLNETDSTVPPGVQSFLDSSRSHERRRTRRLRGLRKLVGMLAAVVVLLAAGIAFQQRRAAHNLANLAIASEFAGTSRELAAQRPDAAMLLAVEAFHLAETPATRSALLNAQSQYFAGRLTGHSDTINEVVFSPDGRLLATASADGTARLWDVVSRRQIATLDSSSLVRDVEFSPDGGLLVTAGAKGAQLWDVASHQRIDTVSGAPDTTISTATFSPDGRLLATVSADGSARLWDVASRQQIVPLDSTGSINKAVFSPDGRHLATTVDGSVQLWDVTNPSQPTPLDTPAPPTDRSGHVNAVVFSPDGTTLATAGSDGNVRLWSIDDPRHPSVISSLVGDNTIINSIVFSPDGKNLVTADTDGTARLWDVAARRQVGTFKGHNGSLRSVAFHPDGNTVATAGTDHIIRLWDTSGRILSAPAVGPDVHAMEFSPDGSVLATVGSDSIARLWDTVRQVPIATLTDTDGTIEKVVFSGDGRLLATTGVNGTARLWDIARQRRIATLADRDGPIEKVVFSPKDHILATIGKSGMVKLWNVIDPSQPTSDPFLLDDSNSVVFSSVVFSGDGRLLATTGADGAARLWDITRQRLIATLTDDTGFINTVVFSPDGGSLVTASESGSVQRWEADTGRRITPPVNILHPEGSFYPVALSPDGRIQATISNNDTTTTLWDMDRGGEPIAKLAGHTGLIKTAAFSRDSRFFATASDDGTVRLWDLDPDRVTIHLCRVIGTVSKEQWEKLFPPKFSYRTICSEA